MIQFVSQNYTILDSHPFDDTNQIHRLTFTSQGRGPQPDPHRLFADPPRNPKERRAGPAGYLDMALLRDALNQSELMMFVHSRGVTPRAWVENPRLSNFYTVLATSHDTNDTEFVGVVEAKRYPWYAVQFHPEKIPFEGAPALKLRPNEGGLVAAQYFANFFVEECRNNSHRFDSVGQLRRHQMSRYATVDASNDEGTWYFDEVYIFPQNVSMHDAGKAFPTFNPTTPALRGQRLPWGANPPPATQAAAATPDEEADEEVEA
eukprot:GHVU01031105.1.p1 GENE.GHVU01031105.1~~GHVU01031105.1.p1  ORF type:complete len:262 (-),score=50.03 GHVU01031105.1:525-1310(-)